MRDRGHPVLVPRLQDAAPHLAARVAAEAELSTESARSTIRTAPKGAADHRRAQRRRRPEERVNRNRVAPGHARAPSPGCDYAAGSAPPSPSRRPAGARPAAPRLHRARAHPALRRRHHGPADRGRVEPVYGHGDRLLLPPIGGKPSPSTCAPTWSPTRSPPPTDAGFAGRGDLPAG